MSYSLIVAASENGVIGKDNQLPWNIPEDLEFFKNKTKNHAIIMGRKTHESIGRPLPKRVNIVITRNKDYKSKGCIVVHSFSEALIEAYKVDENPFVIGGSQIYNEALENAETVYLSRIKKKVDGDAFFPELSSSEWQTKILEETESVKFLKLERLARGPL